MAYRFTNTDKWNDAWFLDLKPASKLLFLYLCDQCDIGGFLEINYRKIGFDLGLGKQEVESALRGVDEKIAYSVDKKYVFVKNYLKHQKNYPLNEKSTTYKKIVECLESKLLYFGIKDINDFFISPIDTPLMGDTSPIGIGIGNSIGVGNKESVCVNGNVGEKNKKCEFDLSFIETDLFRQLFKEWLIYKREIKDEYKSQKSVEIAYSNLLKLGNNDFETCKDVVYQSIGNNWKGLFGLKSKQSNNQTHQFTNYHQPDSDVINRFNAKK